MSICVAQVAGEATLDQIQNWPAPLYWQAPSHDSGRAVHGGRIRRESSAAAAPTASVSAPAVFVAMTPCRIVDTRYQTAPPSGPFGAPPFVATEIRTIAVPSGPCTVPANAVAYSLNIAVVPNPPGSPVRWLTAWDTGSFQPTAATLNDKAGLITSNSAVVPAGSGGAIDIYVTDPTNVIIDINGYYAPPSTLPLSGTAAAPALTFGDTSTGFYSDANATVSIATGGTNRMTVRSDGDVELPGSIRKGGTLFLHNLGFLNTAVGLMAMDTFQGKFGTALGYRALQQSDGDDNTAVGYMALATNAGGGSNTATGSRALISNSGGFNNTANGTDALYVNYSGSYNTALGAEAMATNISGFYNTAIGWNALTCNTSGSNNIAIGAFAGMGGCPDSSSSYNIYIGTRGVPTDNSTTRIGGSTLNGDLVSQTQFFASGIRGIVTGNADAIPVVIDSSGQLGTTSSSRRVKQDIQNMGDTTETILGLRPVRFHYKAHGADSPLQYGLIAEEVAEVAPDLVVRNKDGEIETVYYDKVNAMLLNEVQKLHRENQEQREMLRKLESHLAEIDSRVK